MIRHMIFPTLITEFSYDFPQKFKDTFFSKVYQHVDENGNSNEKTGHVTLHHDQDFKPLYKFIHNSLTEFVSSYGTDPQQIDIYIVKSWLNIIRDVQTPYHNHADAHISFVYYVNIPDDIVEPIRFFADDKGRYEPYNGFCKFANHSNQWTHINSVCWEFFPVEGHLLVFPSKIPHDTQLRSSTPKNMDSPNIPIENLKRKRISIAGDAVITFREKTAVAMGLQPVKNWRKF
jgi:hypothetical protein